MFKLNVRSFALNSSCDVGKKFPQFEKISGSTTRVLARFLMSGGVFNITNMVIYRKLTMANYASAQNFTGHM